MKIENCSTIYLYFDKLSSNTNIIMACFYIGITVVVLCVNMALLAALVATRQVFSNTSNTFITFATVIDLFNGAISMPLLTAVRMNHGHLSDCLLPTASHYTALFLTNLASVTILLTALDRYLHMRPSLKGRKYALSKIFRGKWVILPLAGAVLFSTAMSVVYIVLKRIGKAGNIIAVCLITAFELILTYSIAMAYLRGYFQVSKFVKRSPLYDDKLGHAKSESRRSVAGRCASNKPVYMKRLQTTVTMLVAVLLVTCTPYMISSTALSVFLIIGQTPRELLTVYDVTIVIMFFYFILNSFIVFKMNKRARAWILNRLKCRGRPKESGVKV